MSQKFQLHVFDLQFVILIKPPLCSHILSVVSSRYLFQVKSTSLSFKVSSLSIRALFSLRRREKLYIYIYVQVCIFFTTLKFFNNLLSFCKVYFTIPNRFHISYFYAQYTYSFSVPNVDVSKKARIGNIAKGQNRQEVVESYDSHELNGHVTQKREEYIDQALVSRWRIISQSNVHTDWIHRITYIL